ncbi:protein kinase [Microbispora cellulosiformans]|uniref:non-specific serine/threonine protein kinase n=1 Tax=Microbispora cellulosiformans TaxID=2614688 RepID=A0A5J5K2L4_9ACTN|nr:serine/threonine-protein kinase [Microbispora cellulosiformans]KAA9378498.1 protein kinase [Microbispora cellulosiformans]
MVPSVLGGRYELEDLIGRGGMGEVWRGRDLRAHRPVAVKILAPQVAGLASRERFAREARAAARIVHPNVVTVLDVGEEDARPYLVMELLTGRSLAEELTDRGRYSVAEACDLTSQAAAGLDAAHRAGVVHRDVKPANLHRTASGALKVVDFGVAQVATEAARLTAVGAFVGTAAYLAPEQIEGRGAGAACDLYALGCVCYELLCGQPPFTGSAPELVYRHIHQAPVPPSRHRPDIPAELERLILALLAKDPAARPAGAEAARRVLAAVALTTGQAPHPAASHPSGSYPAASHPSGSYPAASHPSGSYPAASHPSGSFPAGASGSTGPSGSAGTAMPPGSHTFPGRMSGENAAAAGIFPGDPGDSGGGGTRAGDTALLDVPSFDGPPSGGRRFDGPLGGPPYGGSSPGGPSAAGGSPERRTLIRLGAAVGGLAVIVIGVAALSGPGGQSGSTAAAPTATATRAETSPTPARTASPRPTPRPATPRASSRPTAAPTPAARRVYGGYQEWLAAFDHAVQEQESQGGIEQGLARRAHDTIRKAARDLLHDRGRGRGDKGARRVYDLVRELQKARRDGRLADGPLTSFLNTTGVGTDGGAGHHPR